MTNNTALLLAESSIWTRNQDKASPEDKTSKKTLFRFSFFHFSRATSQRKEHCVLFADTNTKDEQKELFQLLDASQQCTMVCFLRASQPSSGRWNPLHGNWISVAKTPERCREHVMDEGSISKKSFVDYYTMELGDELNHAGDYVSRSIYNLLSPLIKPTEKYIQSWQNGDQQAFLTKFWKSLQNGDGFYLVKNSTKRLIDNALDRKPNDKK